jgi:hypothetical protein
MRILLILLLLWLYSASCGRDPDPREVRGVNPEFTSYYELFEKRYQIRVGDVSIGFASLPYPTVGLCSIWVYKSKIPPVRYRDYRQITIDPYFWANSDEDARTNLILHELGHCRFDRDHETSLLSSGIPESLMFPTLLGGTAFNDYYDYYLRELADTDTTLPEGLLTPPDDEPLTVTHSACQAEH